MKHPKIMFTLGTFLGISIALSMAANADRLSRFNDLAEQKGAQWGVNPNLIRAIVSVESAGRLDAVSPAGARGVMQLMPATAERMGVSRHELFDPERNMEAGVRYLAFLNKRYNGNPTLVAAGYNAGEGAVDKYGGVPPYRETQNYAPAVVSRLRLLDACGTACYTTQHMRNPSAFLNAFNGGSMNTTASANGDQMQRAATVDSWLGKKSNFVQQTQTVKTPSVKKTVQITSAQPVYSVQAKPQHIEKRNSGFVQTLQSDGTYQSF